MKLFKCPLSSYEHKYQQAFNQLQSMKTLKLKISEESINPNTNFISILNNSFQTHDSNPSPSAYHFLIKYLSQKHLLKHVNLVLDHLEKIKTFDLPERFFITLINYYGNKGMLQDAINIFYRIPKFRCTPSVHSLNSLLIFLCESEEGLNLVRNVLMKTLEMGIRLEMSTFRILIKALCENGKVGYAVELLDGMLLEDYMPDAKIYSLVLKHLCKNENGGSVAVNFLKVMEKAGFFPSVSDYNNVIDVLVREGKVDTACLFLSKMKYEGTRPDILSYNIVLHGYLMSNDFKKVDELFDEILLIGLVPNVATYNTYIHGLCKQGEVERACRMVICMEKAGCMPEVTTFNVILYGYANVGMMEKAKEAMNEMLRKGFDWNACTYENLIVGLIGKGEIIEAYKLFVEMMDKGQTHKTKNGRDLISNTHPTVENLSFTAAKFLAPAAKFLTLAGPKFHFPSVISFPSAKHFIYLLASLPPKSSIVLKSSNRPRHTCSNPRLSQLQQSRRHLYPLPEPRHQVAAIVT